ncbi:PEP-utilizing enzyme [Sandaracinobacteroides saxicola]|uniref:Phosphoenolpyruvate-utilizing protein n=1 Tax=Sandaracinobacteroides saxicola TaxID=2759707 RepID=A0A7G5IJI2_9SPHN|nr:PEP-utilizing enzyme [Sandaracinobacteroides saxicola]QMW23524.1 phosphoenolpyruvate-utilizing protein [Sandaracinobacteroides saxicola]
MAEHYDGARAVATVTAESAAAGRWIVDNAPSPRYPIYTRANVGEVFPEVVQPLSWTLWGIRHAEPGWREAFANLGAFDLTEFTPDRMEVLGVFGGYCYLNVSASRIFGTRTPGMSAEAIDASFFGGQPDVPAYVEAATDVSAVHSERLGAMLGWLFSVESLPDLDAMRAEVEGWRAARPDLGTADDAALLAHVEALCAAMFRKLWVRHIEATYHSMIPAGVIAGVCAAVGRGELAADILTSDALVDSARPAHALWALSRQVKASPVLGALFDAGADGLEARLRRHAPDFAEAFDGFLRAFGFRGPMEWEMRSRAWEIDRATPLAAIERMRGAGDDESPAARAERRQVAKAAAVADVEALLAGDEATLGQFRAAVAAAGRFFAARERTKTSAAMLIHEMRMAMWELGARFVARGLFERADQFGLLTLDEWRAALADASGVAATVAARGAEEARLAAREPPFIVDGVVPPLDSFRVRGGGAAEGKAASGALLQGVPGCAGVARGVARIVHDPAEPGDMEPGDILVAPHTDPAWTPLMAAAGAVVVNVGATVSHAVIVARELGVPCAVSVTGATALIPEGAMIEVDGGAGTVRIL